MVAERQKAKKWEPGPNMPASVQKRCAETLPKKLMASVPLGTAPASGKAAGKPPSGRARKGVEPETKFV